jgi:chromatin remodeling complex protein RSC6
MGKGSAINKKLELSPEFQQFMGSRTAARGEVNSRLWKYIRDNDLKDEDGTVRCDSYLRELLGCSSMKGVGGVSKAISKAGAFLV